MRKSVLLSTKNKVTEFLKNLEGKITTSDLIKKTGVDFYSLQILKKDLPRKLQDKIK